MLNKEITDKDVSNAIIFATIAHMNQIDKDGLPYILHPLAVMAKVKTNIERVVALLHDTMEDCGVTYAQVYAEFGQEVADAVSALTRQGENGPPEQKEKYFDYIQRVKKNPLAVTVKLADLEHNSSPERIKVLPPDKQGVVHRYDKARRILLNQAPMFEMDHLEHSNS